MKMMMIKPNFWLCLLFVVMQNVMAELEVSQIEKHWQHESRVNAVAFSPDGRWLASGSAILKIWDVTSKSWPRTLETKTSIKAVAFSPNGQWLASVSVKPMLKLWNMKSGQLQYRLRLRKRNMIYSISFSPDDKCLASGGGDHTVKLWDVSSGQLQHTLKGHKGEVYSTAFAPNGKWLASGSKDKTIKIWDVESARLQHSLAASQGEIYSVAISPNGKYLASGGEGFVKLWDMNSGELQHSWIQGWKIKSIAFSPNGAWLASANGRGEMIKIWDIESGELLHTVMKAHVDGVESIAFSPNGQWLVSAGDRMLKLWEIKRVPADTKAPDSEESLVEPIMQVSENGDQAFDFSNIYPWFIKAIAIIVSVILLVSFIWWIIQRFSPSLRPHAPRIMVSIIVGITVGVSTTAIAYYLFDSPETATISGVALAVVAHYFTKGA